VKWPYIFFGLVDAITGKKRPYSLTPKVKTEGRKPFMTWPHLVVLGLLLGSWLIGSSMGTEHYLLLKLAVGMVMVSSSLAVWTETWEFPAPFDIKILEAELGKNKQ
jgi:hypothetical protein